MVLFQLAFKPAQQRKSIGGGSGKAREYTIVVKAANFFRVGFHDGFAKRYLTVAGERNMAIFTHKQHSRAADDWSFSSHFY
jgi:hypothetical protein